MAKKLEQPVIFGVNELFKGALQDQRFAEAEKLLGEGANINRLEYYTVLGQAICDGRENTVRWLLDHGASLECPASKYEKERNPVALAYECGFEKIAAILQEEILVRMQKETPEWSLFGSGKVAHVEISPKLCRRLTEIFNFESRERMMIEENLNTKQEVILPLTSFDDLPQPYIEKALDKFLELGGQADRSYVLKAKYPLKNKTLLPR